MSKTYRVRALLMGHDRSKTLLVRYNILKYRDGFKEFCLNDILCHQ